MCRNSFSDNKAANNLHLHRTKCSAITKNILHSHFLDDLLNDLGSGPFSLILDESTDISITKLLGMAIVYYSERKGSVMSTFLCLAELQQCNAQSIVDALKACAKRIGLDLRKMRGIRTDNAAVMIGTNNGVYQKVKAEIPSLILVRCVCTHFSSQCPARCPKHCQETMNF